MAKKKMSMQKKIAIGAGVAAVVGAILCYFYCPCFKKGAAVPAEPGVTGDSRPPIDFLGPANYPLTLPQAQQSAAAAVASAPIALNKAKVKAAILDQRGLLYPVSPII